jgi:hypothetical protein
MVETVMVPLYLAVAFHTVQQQTQRFACGKLGFEALPIFGAILQGAFDFGTGRGGFTFGSGQMGSTG